MRERKVDLKYYLELCTRFYQQRGHLSLSDTHDLLFIEKWVARKAEGPINKQVATKPMHDAMYPDSKY